MSVKLLNADLISRIKSSSDVSSVTQCVFELVCNSLDAKSTSIAVRLNLITYKIEVIDNGEGISRQNLDLVGVRYATSKCRSLKDLEHKGRTYGFRGESIASIVELCDKVVVTSRYKDSTDTFSKTLMRGQDGEVSAVKLRPSVGTTVSVLGWFSPMPVRRQRIVLEIELAAVKKQLERLIIINPTTSFTLRNDLTGLLIVNFPKHTDILDAFCYLNNESANQFVLIKVSKRKIALDLLIKKELTMNKGMQFVYVNKHPVKSCRIVNYFQKKVKKCKEFTEKVGQAQLYPVYVLNIKCPRTYVDFLFRDSRCEVEFSCWDLVLACVDRLARSFLEKDPQFQEPSQKHSPVKESPNLNPPLTCNSEEQDGKTLIMDLFLKSTIVFNKRKPEDEEMAVHTKKSRSSEDLLLNRRLKSFSTQLTEELDGFCLSPEANQCMIKTDQKKLTFIKKSQTENCIKPVKPLSWVNTQTCVPQQSRYFIRPYTTDVGKRSKSTPSKSEVCCSPDIFDHSHPITNQVLSSLEDQENYWKKQVNEFGKAFYVNQRTGMVTTKTPVLKSGSFNFHERPEFVPKGMSQALVEPKLVDTSLSENADHQLNDLLLQGYEGGDDELLLVKWQHCIANDPKAFFEEIYKEKSKHIEKCIPSIRMTNSLSFKAESLRKLEVIGQLDKKFIAALEPKKKLILLFDQHAVHERVRLEQALKECKGDKAGLTNRLTVFMPRNDVAFLESHVTYLDSVGLGVEYFKNGVHITHVPRCLSERQDLDLFAASKALLKEILEFLRDTRGASRGTMLPKLIQNIISSKACRGAIKFGDTLTYQHCDELLRDLSTCMVPFQCAHGRPTLAPIIDLEKVQCKEQAMKPNLKKLTLNF